MAQTIYIHVYIYIYIYSTFHTYNFLSFWIQDDIRKEQTLGSKSLITLYNFL